MRAKTIKNTARINAELSPLELKGLLKKAQAANAQYQTYIAALEAELAIWRSGGSVSPNDWAAPDKAIAIAKKPTSPTPSTPARSGTPINPIIENLRADLDSRPQTPTVVGLDKDEKDDFLKRENELSDQLAEKVRGGRSLCTLKLTFSGFFLGSRTHRRPESAG
jgi:kinesin family protein 5